MVFPAKVESEDHSPLRTDEGDRYRCERSHVKHNFAVCRQMVNIDIEVNLNCQHTTKSGG